MSIATFTSAIMTLLRAVLPVIARFWAWLRRLFLTHPHAVGESYWVHLGFVLRMAPWLLFLGFVLLLHGVFPFAFTTTTSRQLQRMIRIMQRRGAEAKPRDAGPDHDAGRDI